MKINRRSKIFGISAEAIIDKVKESLASVLPVALVVFVLSVTVTPIDAGTALAFLLGLFCVSVGMGFFTSGAETGMTQIGRYVSVSVIKTKKLWFILPIFFIVGILITVSEPDLQVLAKEVGGTINYYVLLISVGIGVGLFLVFAFLRIVLNVKLRYILIASYTAVFVMAFFVPSNFVPLAFDSGGVTTGPMSVPFIIAMGTGVVYLRSDKSAEEDAFGLTALCSIGPIIAVMILGIIFRPENIAVSGGETFTVINSKQLFAEFSARLPIYLKEVVIAIVPILLVYFACMIFGGKIGKTEFARTIMGVFNTYVGLVLFLLGVNCGFLPVGAFIGETIGKTEQAFIAIPIGMVLGFFIVGAEPAVHVLNDQVYEITGGTLPKKALMITLMTGVAISIGLSFLRIYFAIPIMWFLIPTYAIALILSFFVPEMFTAIAFDSGGVASGAMTAGFLMPMALGFCESLGKNAGTEGFGLVAFVAMTPLIAVQILGLVFKIKNAKIKKEQNALEEMSEEIID